MSVCTISMWYIICIHSQGLHLHKACVGGKLLNGERQWGEK